MISSQWAAGKLPVDAASDVRIGRFQLEVLSENFSKVFELEASSSRFSVGDFQLEASR